MTIDEKIDSLKQELYQLQYEKYCIESAFTGYNSSKEPLIDYAKRIVIAAYKDAEIDMDNYLFVPIDERRVLIISSDRQTEEVFIVQDYTGYESICISAFNESKCDAVKAWDQIDIIQDMMRIKA